MRCVHCILSGDSCGGPRHRPGALILAPSDWPAVLASDEIILENASWRVPFGEQNAHYPSFTVPTSSTPQVVTDQLLGTGLFDAMTPRVDEDEHSIEMHLPFIKQVLR